MPGEAQSMAQVWELWLGQSVNEKFPLRRYLGGSERGAAFLTEWEGQKATIKLIPADPAKADRQLSNWNLALKLSHPHLIRLFDFGRCQLPGMQMIFVVMEHAEENLAQILPNRALTPAEARDMLEPTLEALAYVHSHGFVHGHLKPDNILAVGDQLKLSSDGLSRAGESGGGAIKTGAYDAPEKSRGDTSPAGDVWSLGMTLVEALTQRRPASDSSGMPVLPQKLPAPFDDIVHECLKRDPQQRATVAGIMARLKLPSTPRELAKSREAVMRGRLILPIVAVFIVIAVLVADPRFLERTRERQQAVPIVGERPKPQLKTETSSAPPATEPPARAITPPAKPSPARSQPGARQVVESNSAPQQAGIVEQVVPDVSPSARNTIQGTVRVRIRVHVDPSGNVVGAEFDSPGPSNYFARLAIEAARKWKFAPEAESREWILRFGFRRTGTQVDPVQLTR
jgi:TonB family protein